MIDPRQQNADLLADAGSYLIASQCHPDVFDRLADKDLGMFHLVGSALEVVDGKTICRVDGTLIGGSITAGLAAMCLVHTLGYRKQHLYGYDSSYADGEHHAYVQDQSDQESMTLDVTVFDRAGERRQFTTNFAMAKQAELFPSIAEMLVNADAELFVHGGGLLPTIAQSLHKQEVPHV